MNLLYCGTPYYLVPALAISLLSAEIGLFCPGEGRHGESPRTGVPSTRAFIPSRLSPGRTSALARALKEAKLKFLLACVEAIDYPARRELDKAVIRQLATCRWVPEYQNVIIVGATGVGKSFIGCALAVQACRNGFRAYYRRAPRFLHDLALARADGTYVRVLGKLARIDVLLIDDWGPAPLAEQERRDVLEILEDGTAIARPSSRANCRQRSGTTTLPMRRSPTRSATASCTTLIESC